ncbi:MAG TPA: ABC-F family ATP-binding cassette domain-containing protein [Dehalococcoidia bacterium]
MIKASNLGKSFGGRTLFRDVSFVVNAGEFAGLVGPNGSGKTTLLTIVAGEARADTGGVDVSPSLRVAHLTQGYATRTTWSVRDAFPALYREEAVEQRLAALAAEIATTPGEPNEKRAREYEQLLAEVERTGASDASEALRHLGIRAIDADEPLAALSGGEQTKLGLANVVATNPDILLLDEPTNNLDLDAVAWLDGYLAHFRGAVFAVSHDRALLDDHASKILEVDPVTQRVELYPGNYSAYAVEKARRRDDLWARYQRQEERERRVKREIRSIKDTAQRRESTSQNDFYRRKAKKIARRAVVLERRLGRELNTEERIDKPIRREFRVKPDVSASSRGGDRMLAAGNITISPGGAALIERANFEVGWGERVVLLGPNGSGKTTLMDVINGARPASGVVRLSPSTQIGYLPQHDEAPSDGADTAVSSIRAITELSETEARRHLHRFLFAGDDALTPVSRLSYGERKRLALAKLVLGGANLLLLDEPTNHLDLPSREAFEAALDEYDGAMIVATHDRFFIERFANRIWRLTEKRLTQEY